MISEGFPKRSDSGTIGSSIKAIARLRSIVLARADTAGRK
jgi:hypothetical protein